MEGRPRTLARVDLGPAVRSASGLRVLQGVAVQPDRPALRGVLPPRRRVTHPPRPPERDAEHDVLVAEVLGRSGIESLRILKGRNAVDRHATPHDLDDGRLMAYDAYRGNLIYRTRIGGSPGAYVASPIAADGRLYFTTEEWGSRICWSGETCGLTSWRMCTWIRSCWCHYISRRRSEPTFSFRQRKRMACGVRPL